MDWIDLAIDRWRALLNRVINLWVPQVVASLLNCFTTRCLSRGADPHEVSYLEHFFYLSFELIDLLFRRAWHLNH
jgi:hypothetical protein